MPRSDDKVPTKVDLEMHAEADGEIGKIPRKLKAAGCRRPHSNIARQDPFVCNICAVTQKKKEAECEQDSLMHLFAMFGDSPQVNKGIFARASSRLSNKCSYY